MQDLQEAAAAERGETVTAGGLGVAAVDDVYVVPPDELLLERAVDRGVGVLDAAERLVGEDDAEAEGVVGGVALPEGDIALRVQPLEQRRGVEPAGAAADDGDAVRAAWTDCRGAGPRGTSSRYRPCHFGGRFSVKAAWNSA